MRYVGTLLLAGLWCIAAVAAVSQQDARLIQAVNTQNVAAARTALDAGASANALVGKVQVLQLAAISGNEELVSLLLERGADPSAKDPEGRTAADYAQTFKHETLAARLQAAVAKPAALAAEPGGPGGPGAAPPAHGPTSPIAAGGGDPQSLFRQLDINEDGVLSGTETKGLKALDFDGDGRITLAEYRRGAEAARPANAQPPSSLPPVSPIARRAEALSLDRSPIVRATPGGGPAVVRADGKPVDGIKLSQHDWGVESPGIAVGPDGTIHTAYFEKKRGTGKDSVYYRASTDGGKTWGEPTNISEAMPTWFAGPCQVAVDGAGRAYVIWRTAVRDDIQPSFEAGAGISHIHHNLVYRVLADGRWSKAVPVHPPADTQSQKNGSLAWFVSTDPKGRVHVVWNTNPDSLRPGLRVGGGSYKTLPIDIGDGLVMQATLDGAKPGAPREIWSAKIVVDPISREPRADGYECLDGYVDGEGRAIFAAAAMVPRTREPQTQIAVFEGGKQTLGCTLPGDRLQLFESPPRLLVDARGRKHLIALYTTGEHPSVRDHVAGSDAEAAVIRESKGLNGRADAFQAYQGPGGRMAVLMQFHDDEDGDSYLSTSDGGNWSPPVNVTNNGGRKQFLASRTGAEATASASVTFEPGPGAIAFDSEGHLLLAMVVKQRTLANNAAFGVSVASGESVRPTLVFLKF